VPVHLLQPVHLPVDAHAPSGSVVVEAQLHPSTKFRDISTDQTFSFVAVFV
jgi:hypothetical protein